MWYSIRELKNSTIGSFKHKYLNYQTETDYFVWHWWPLRFFLATPLLRPASDPEWSSISRDSIRQCSTKPAPVAYRGVWSSGDGKDGEESTQEPCLSVVQLLRQVAHGAAEAYCGACQLKALLVHNLQ